MKFKEITYEHAEGFAAGELKHGPFALLDSDAVVFVVATGSGEVIDKAVSDIEEIKARNVPVVAVTTEGSPAADHADRVLTVPPADDWVAPLLANVHLQLVSYRMASRQGRPIDKPRNLAKSVTVE